MKRTTQFTCYLLLLFMTLGLLQEYSLAQRTSPSAVAAVRLKYRPPNNWIRHYLGDDRYKIAGNIWKVVSTQTDTYYHRANCPNMLRQPAGTVIGFADSDEADESGYTPDPTCAPSAPRVEYQPSSAASGAGAGGAAGGLAPASANIRITLSDGVSTTILPKGWIHIRNKPQQGTNIPSIQGASFDLMIPASALQQRGGKPTMVMYMFMTAPNVGGVEQYLTPSGFNRLNQRMRNNGRGGRFSTVLNQSNITSAQLGGLRGIKITPRAAVNGLNMPISIVGRGSKLYMMASSLSSANNGYKLAVNSFQPR